MESSHVYHSQQTTGGKRPRISECGFGTGRITILLASNLTLDIYDEDQAYLELTEVWTAYFWDPGY